MHHLSPEHYIYDSYTTLMIVEYSPFLLEVMVILCPIVRIIPFFVNDIIVTDK